MKPKKQLNGKELLLDICNYPNKYTHVMNVPCWYEAAQTLIEIGCKLGITQMPAVMVMKRELLDNQVRCIAIETNWNLN